MIQSLASLQTLETAASVIRGAAQSVSTVLPWPIQQPVAVLGSDLASVIALQPDLDGVGRLVVSPFFLLSMSIPLHHGPVSIFHIVTLAHGCFACLLLKEMHGHEAMPLPHAVNLWSLPVPTLRLLVYA